MNHQCLRYSIRAVHVILEPHRRRNARCRIMVVIIMVDKNKTKRRRWRRRRRSRKRGMIMMLTADLLRVRGSAGKGVSVGAIVLEAGKTRLSACMRAL